MPSVPANVLSTRKMSEVTGISRTSIQRILKHYKWHPYKIQLLHELNEDDHDRRLQFCEIMSPIKGFKDDTIYKQKNHREKNMQFKYNNGKS
nr:unnamed protein product [Callosobruchus chinensis]